VERSWRFCGVGLRNLGARSLGHGTAFRSVGGFFLLMYVSTALEHGLREGLWGWVWTMVWAIGWGTLIIDALARRGIMASEFFPFGPHPGNSLVNAFASLSWRESDIYLSLV
jgi:hypothetical protein